MDRVVDPIVADIQSEHDHAVRAGRRWIAAWILVRGYYAFWKAVSLHTLQSGPRMIWNSIAADRWALGRIILSSLIVGLSVTVLLSVWPMIKLYSRIQSVRLALLLLPQAILLSIPIAVSLAVVGSASRIPAGARRIRRVLGLAIVATLIAFAVFVVIIPGASLAWGVAMSEELELRGITNYSLARGINDMTLSELGARIRAYDAAGSPERAHQFRRGYHSRFALPAATFVLGLLALALCEITRSRAARVVALILGFGLYGALMAAESSRSTLLTILSVWAPNIVLTAVSLSLLKVSSRGPSTQSISD